MEQATTAGGIEVRSLPAGRGVDWISEGFALFKRAPGAWIGILVVWFLVSVGLAVINAELVSTFLNPVFGAGLILGCVALTRGEALRVSHLFAAFQGGRFGTLMLMVLIQIGLAVGLVLAVAAVVLGMLGVSGAAPPDLDGMNPLAIALLLLLLLALILPLAMLTWFAPALIVLRGQDAWPAMKLSLDGCLRNWLPLLVYGLVGLLVLVVAALPLLLGLLVAIPVLAASVYTSYRDIYPEKSGSESNSGARVP